MMLIVNLLLLGTSTTPVAFLVGRGDSTSTTATSYHAVFLILVQLVRYDLIDLRAAVVAGDDGRKPQAMKSYCCL